MTELTREQILNMPAGSEMDSLITTHIFCVDGFWHGIKPYSTNISAAWDVVEKLLQKYSVYIEGKDNEWFCDIEPLDEHVCLEFNTTAPTAPLAICHAALLAILELFWSTGETIGE